MLSWGGMDGHDRCGDRGLDFASNEAMIARQSWFFAKDDSRSMKIKLSFQSSFPERSTSRPGERKIGAI